jgi:nucleoside 2-deoxyribosyltransferase
MNLRRVYLAGPDVFLPSAGEWLQRKKVICADHALHAVSPLDVLADEPSEWLALPEWRRIALRNEAHIRSCDALIANLTPFRGPSADVGTVYELGFMRALGRPVFGYASVDKRFTARTLDYARSHGGAVAGRGGVWRDAEDLLVEQFGRFDNLMIDAAIAGAGAEVIHQDPATDDRWRDLTVFESCVRRVADALAGAG